MQSRGAFYAHGAWGKCLKGSLINQVPEKKPRGINWGDCANRLGCAGPAGLSVFIPKAVGSLWCVSGTGKSRGKSPL